MTTLEATIGAVASRCLHGRPGGGSHPTAVDLDTPFEWLGLDSLATIELAAALEDELGCELPADVLVGCTDARSLAGRLARLGVGDARTADDPFDQMVADAALPDDIRPASDSVHPDTGLRNAGTILLTGATGFLGSAILAELLDTSNATIVCLVRSTSLPIRTSGTGRIRTITGDLSHPRFGLSESKYDGLAREVDAVCHAAAAVNWVFSYAGLRGANVLGTLELLRLACRAGAAFHFVSSLSTCYSTSGPRTADEDFDALSELRGIHLGYAQTKVVGEALTREAGRRGLPVRIYRPSLISGYSLTGAFNRDDLISALVRGCVRMGIAPDLDWKLDCEPVDVVAKAIVALSASRETVFHLGHVRPRHWRECVLWMRMYGYDVRLVSYHAWLRRLERETVPGADGIRRTPAPPAPIVLSRPPGRRARTDDAGVVRGAPPHARGEWAHAGDPLGQRCDVSRLGPRSGRRAARDVLRCLSRHGGPSQSTSAGLRGRRCAGRDGDPPGSRPLDSARDRRGRRLRPPFPLGCRRGDGASR